MGHFCLFSNTVFFYIVRLCSSQQDFRKMATYLNDTDELSPSQMKTILLNMGCKIHCDYEQYIYDIILDDTNVQDPDAENYAYLSGFFFIRNEDIRVETEAITYDFISLLTDVGGITGLFLGYSLLSLYDFFIEFVFSFFEVPDGMERFF